MPSNLDGPAIIRAEVEKAIGKASKGKAPGEDGSTTEIIVNLEDFGVDECTELYHDMYETGHIPAKLLTYVYIPVPKNTKQLSAQITGLLV